MGDPLPSPVKLDALRARGGLGARSALMMANPLRLEELLRRQLWEASWGQLVCGKDVKGPRVLTDHQPNTSQLRDRKYTNGERSYLVERRGPPGGPGLVPMLGPFWMSHFKKVM